MELKRLVMKQHILLVDDDKDELTLFEDALEKVPGESRFKCLFAGSGSEALDILKFITPEYIFLDINMPVMDGLELLGRIKEEPNTKHIKIYLHSTKITDLYCRAAMEAGASGCIRKVGTIQELTNELIPVLVPGPFPAS
jgi:CheY-like chemotaxis protein